MKNFKIGDIVHYMEYNKPVSKEVVGIATLEGEVQTTGGSLTKNKQEPTKVILFTGSYSYIDPKLCFTTLVELKTSVFPSEVGERECWEKD